MSDTYSAPNKIWNMPKGAQTFAYTVTVLFLYN